MPIANAKDGCPINYQVEGPADAPVLMLCNSLGTNLHMWDDQAAAWSKQFRLVRYDRRGHGKSGAPKGPYTMDMLGHDALAVADAAGAKKFNWCGLSMGGMVGQWMGANARDRVEKLVLSNTHYHYADKQPWHDRIKFAQDNGLEKLSGPQMERWFTKGFRERSPRAGRQGGRDVHRDQARRLRRLLRGGARHGLPRLDADHHRADHGDRRQPRTRRRCRSTATRSTR